MTRLLVLWLLNEGPMHGYQIKKALSDSGMSFWFGVEDASIYSVLRTLTKNGYANELPPERSGNRPPRTRYAITADGRRFYRVGLAKAMATPSLPVAPIDVALAARGDLDAVTVGRAIAGRTKALHELELSMTQARPAAPSQAMVERNLAIVRAELDWLADLDQAAIS